MSLLWPQVDNHTKVLLFMTDAGSYMVKAAKHLKISYPTMIHITCMALKSSMKCIISFITIRLYLSATFLSYNTSPRSLSIVNAERT